MKVAESEGGLAAGSTSFFLEYKRSLKHELLHVWPNCPLGIHLPQRFNEAEEAGPRNRA